MDQKTNDRISTVALDRPRPETHPETTPKPAGKPPKRRKTGWLLLLLVIIGAGAGYYFYGRPAAETPQQSMHKRSSNLADAAQPVGVATVATGDMRVTYDALGTVTPLATVTVKTQINGYLQSVAFQEGQYVKKGDFLAQIDPRPFEVAELQFEGQLLKDQGSLLQSKADLVRFQTLMKQDSIAKQQAENQIFVVQQNEGAVKSDQAQVDAQKLNLIYCHIITPVSGRVGLRQVDAGNYVQTSDPNGIVIVTQLDPISVIFTVPEDLLPPITAEMKANHELTTIAYDRANTRELGTGRVTVLDNQVDTTTGTVKLRAEFPNPDNKLFPNQFVNIRLLIQTLKDVTLAPNAAIQRGAPGTYVYLVQGDKVAVRKVAVERVENEKAMITSGLAVGDRVVIDGTDRLRDGANITIPTASNSAEPEANPPNANTNSDPENKPAAHKGKHSHNP
jgi:membrane fusion protein, multidrug efflux system